VPAGRDWPQDRVSAAGEHGGVLPDRVEEAQRSNRYLSRLERQRIATLRAQGLGVREIARRLERAPSTITRELVRNLRPHDRNVYGGDLTHARARQRAQRPRMGRLALDSDLRAVVQAKLELEWSPEQIAGWLRTQNPERPAWWICHEAIYQALYRGGKGGLSSQLTRKLRTRPAIAPAAAPRRRTLPTVRRAGTVDRAPAAGGGGPRPRRVLGGRPDRRADEPVRDRHSGRAVQPPGPADPPPDGHRADQLLEAIEPVLSTPPALTRLTLT
jgi:transposase, IS30 family